MKKENKRTVCDFLTSWVDPKTDDYYSFDLDFNDVENKTVTVIEINKDKNG